MDRENRGRRRGATGGSARSEVGEVEGRVYIAMQFINGVALDAAAVERADQNRLGTENVYVSIDVEVVRIMNLSPKHTGSNVPMKLKETNPSA